jgi:rod shape-determining protein MreD
MTFWQKFDRTGRNLAPPTLTIFLVLINLVPSYLPGLDRVPPALSLMSIYYWAIHRPDLFRPSVSFTIGLLEDLLNGTPFGLTALSLVLTHWLVVTQRTFFLANTFTALWWGFGLIALGNGVLRWWLSALLAHQPLPVSGGLFQILVTIALFPPLAGLLMIIHRFFLQRP